MKCRVIFYRYTWEQLLADRDPMGLLYRIATIAFGYEGPTHVAVWLQDESCNLDVELGHTWWGSYARTLPYTRRDSFYQVYSMPESFGIKALEQSEDRSFSGIDILDLWRHYQGVEPKGETCLTWAQYLLDIYPAVNTMTELERVLLEKGGVPRYTVT